MFTVAMPGTFTWSFEQGDATVKVNFRVDYSVSFGTFGRIADKLFLGRINQRNAEGTLQALKRILRDATNIDDSVIDLADPNPDRIIKSIVYHEKSECTEGTFEAMSPPSGLCRRVRASFGTRRR